MEDSFYESQELKRFLLGSKRHLLLKAVSVLSLFSNRRDGNKLGLSNIEVKDIETIEFRNVKVSMFHPRIKKYEKKCFLIP